MEDRLLPLAVIWAAAGTASQKQQQWIKEPISVWKGDSRVMETARTYPLLSLVSAQTLRET